LEKKGNDVTVVDKHNVDLTNPNETRNAITALGDKEKYSIIHLAGMYVKGFKESKEAKDEDFFRINHEATKNLVDAILDSKLKVSSFVFSSAFLCNFIENAQDNAYTVSKHRAEQEVKRLEEVCDNVCILRISKVIGMGEPDTMPVDIITDFMKKIKEDEDITISGGNFVRDYVHISDIVRIIQNPKKGIANACSAKAISIKNLSEMILEALHINGAIPKKVIAYKSINDKLAKMSKSTDFAELLQYKTSEDAVRKSIGEYIRFFGWEGV